MVSYMFPEKFPPKSKGFLNPLCDSVPRKQETFIRKITLLLGFQGFRGWKPFPSQETQPFLYGFLTRRIVWP